MARGHRSLWMPALVALCNSKQDNLQSAPQAAWAAAGIQGSFEQIPDTEGVNLCYQLHSVALC